MTVLVVRHARAGRRSAWKDDDRLRPLSGRGQQQAKALAVALADVARKKRRPVEVLSSPWVRCTETVAPLAASLGVDVRQEPALGEGRAEEALELIAGFTHRTVVVCTHGDVVVATLDWLKGSGVDLGRAPSCPKGSTWVLESRAGRYYVARFLPAPA